MLSFVHHLYNFNPQHVRVNMVSQAPHFALSFSNDTLEEQVHPDLLQYHPGRRVSENMCNTHFLFESKQI